MPAVHMRQQWELAIHALLQYIFEIAQLQETLTLSPLSARSNALQAVRGRALSHVQVHNAMPIEKRMVSSMPFTSPATVARHYEQFNVF